MASRFAALALTVCVLASPPAAQSPEGTVVSIGYSEQGPPLNGPAHGFARGANGVLWAWGEFEQRGAEGYDSVARWDGAGWRATGRFQFPGSVNALAISTAGVAYAGGSFTGIDGETISGAARWNGTEWEALGTGIGVGSDSDYQYVKSIVVAQDGSVVVAGWFTRAGSAAVANVARWSGSAWEAVGAGLGSYIETLVEGPDGTLYAGGYLSVGPVAGVPVTGVMRWHGAAWSPFGDVEGYDGDPAFIRQIVAAPDGRLFVLGQFASIGGVAAENLAEWTGTAWQPLGGETFEYVDALAVSPAGDLEVTGRRRGAPTSESYTMVSVWRRAGADWTEVATPIERSYGRLALSHLPDGSLLAGGAFNAVGTGGAEYAAQWNGTEWAALGSRVNASVRHLAATPDGGAYAAGEFTTVPGATAQHVARWTGATWEALGDGLPNMPTGLAVAGDGALYASGGFWVPIGNGEFTQLAPAMRWDGTTWTALVDVSQPLSSESVAVWHGDPYVSASTPMNERRVLRWTGTGWAPVGPAFEGSIRTLAVGPDDALYASGWFRPVGSSAERSRLARWDGTAWEPLSGVFDDWQSIDVLSFGNDGALYASGYSSNSGRTIAVQRSAGAPWEPIPLPPGVSWIRSLTATADGQLYLGGSSSNSDAVVFAWDGAAWDPVASSEPASGGGGNVYTLSLLASDDLLIGGQFEDLAGVGMANAALYRLAVADASEAPAAATVSVTIAPNPARGAARLTATVPAGAAEVSVYDALGRRVAVAFSGETAGALWVPLDLGGLAPGVYHVRVVAGGAVQATRFTVAR